MTSSLFFLVATKLTIVILVNSFRVIRRDINQTPELQTCCSQGVFIYRRANETTKKLGYIWL